MSQPRLQAPAPAGAQNDPNGPSHEENRAHVDAILASPAFLSSKRCRQFLEYVCGQALAGESASLKERTIAVEVFGRNPQSDLADDTIVRVSAREVRKRLHEFYASVASAGSAVRLELPTGSYTPRFYRVAVVEPLPPALPPAAHEVMPQAHPRAWGRIFVVAASLLIVALVAVAAARWQAYSRSAASFSRFWGPVVKGSDGLLLAVAHPIVYHPSERALSMTDEALGPQPELLQRPIGVPPEKLNGSDMIPVLDQYVGFGDLVAATEITSMLARRSKTVRVRMASTLTFEDFRHAQALLIGARTNRWTMEFQQSWRFQFALGARQHMTIVDKTTTGKDRREWSIVSKEDGSAPEDYILICRIHNAGTDSLLFAGAGLKQYGTEAAGRLLANPDQLDAVLRHLPQGWESKNLQVVLHAKVIANAPAQPEVVAWHLWM